MNKTVDFKRKHDFVRAKEVMIVSRETLVKNGEHSYPISEHTHCFQHKMNERDCKMEYGDSAINLILRRLNPIKISNGILVKGSKLALCGQGTDFHINSGINKPDLLNLQLFGSNRSKSHDIELDETGQEILHLTTIIENFI